LVGETELAAHGIELEVASRGGDVTYHGPGQWVLYPILRLDRKTAGARGFLYRLEEVAIRTADSFGIPAYRRQGRAGAWTDHGKIAAIGFRVRRGITSHGMSLNVASDLGGFSRIVPCGLVGEPVASLAGILGAAAPSLDDVAQAMAKACSAVFERPLVEDQVPGRVDHPELARIVDGSLDCPDHPL
jgi:lipoyl(octanoyl) transferase